MNTDRDSEVKILLLIILTAKPIRALSDQGGFDLIEAHWPLNLLNRSATNSMEFLQF